MAHVLTSLSVRGFTVWSEIGTTVQINPTNRPVTKQLGVRSDERGGQEPQP